MADPAEAVPGDAPPGQGDGRFDLGALGLGVPGAARIGAVVEPADQFDRSFQRVEVAVAVIADVHHAPADGAVPVEDVQFPVREVGLLGPEMGHGVDLLVAGGSVLVVLKASEDDTRETAWFLAGCLAVDLKWFASKIGQELRAKAWPRGHAPLGLQG